MPQPRRPRRGERSRMCRAGAHAASLLLSQATLLRQSSFTARLLDSYGVGWNYAMRTGNYGVGFSFCRMESYFSRVISYRSGRTPRHYRAHLNSCRMRSNHCGVSLRYYELFLNYYRVVLNYYRVVLNYYRVVLNLYGLALNFFSKKSHINEETSCRPA